MNKIMNEYFKRKSSEWNISDFLEECGIEEFKQKIENNQPGPDYKLARDWEKNHNKPAKVGVHLNYSTITAINSNIGSETVNARALLGKLPRKRKLENESQAEPDEKPKRKSTRSTNNNIDNYEIEDHNEDDNEAEGGQEINDFTDFDLAYQSLNPAKMWTLESSGRIVEKVIYEHARTLKHESHLHSFILNDVDKKAQSLFRKEEWEEIFSLDLKVVPKIDKSITELMKKYSVTNLPSFRKIIFEPFLPPGTSYSNEEHFYLNYINHAYRAIHTLWEENENFTMNPSSRLEGWYQHNIWSPIIDPAFRNFEIDLIRGEGSSMASSDRKNDDTDCEEDRKKIGRKGDGMFRLNGDRLEFGAIEAGKKWEGRNGKKYITDSLKLSKMLRDMLVQLAKECNSDEQIVRKLQTVGMLHSANRFQLLTLDVPKGYICRIRRFDFHEVASHINNPPLAFVLKDILRARAIIKQTLELVQEKKSYLDDLDDFDDDGREVNRCTTSPTITLNKPHKTPENRL
ncbi:hypothetical protein C2G38_2144522 [Gigaspora rosea]|uniref:Uncharacterized protein n=1 Tax=Gigaspora rosea TaxID=44941 RepID=A0A397UV72_9GLOM|nr:hypothetical protein C2G38_2144522 [Gigaspora rosea]